LKPVQEHVEMGGVVLAGGGQVAIRSEVEPGQRQVAEGSERLRSGAGVGGVGILTKDDVTQPVFSAFDAPVALPQAE